MKKIAIATVMMFLVFGCKNKSEKGKLTVTGEIKNLPDQKIYLEQLFFSQQNPEVLDTADIKTGKFTISAQAPEEGIYRLRLASGQGFIFINDAPDIIFSVDMKDPDIKNVSFSSYANSLLKNFFITLDSENSALADANTQLQQLKDINAPDSILQPVSKAFDDKKDAYQNFVIHFIDTVSDPVMAVFALGSTNSIDPNLLDKPVANLGKRFPNNSTIASVVSQYGQVIMQYNAAPHIGAFAPDINLPDTSGQLFSLKSLRGKYVLVDFWASWCEPCRKENPNVVKAFNQYKDKNFTVLGVSLDENKQAWEAAINMDKLTWNHISDLQSWNSPVVNLYNFSSIPYNVLISPQGKILAFDLRGNDLERKLDEVLK